MARMFKRVDGMSRLFVMGVLENAAGTAATGTAVYTGTASKDGTLTTRIGDKRVSTFIPKDTTAAAAAALHNATVNATLRVPMTSGVSTNTQTFTARAKGTSGNDLTIETTSLPAGITVVDTQPSGGATNPSLAAAIAAWDEQKYDTVITGIADAANMLLLEAEMERRLGGTVKLQGQLFAGVRGTHSAMVTYGDARNARVSTVIGSHLSPTPPWVWAAQAAARDTVQAAALPNRPRNGLTLPDCEAPKVEDQLTWAERNALLYDGISTFKVDPSGRVLIESLITTYQVTASNTADATYLSIGTMRNLYQFLADLYALGAQHERDLLAPDGTNVGPGVPITMPKTFRGEVVALYRSLERGGRMRDTEGFAREFFAEVAEDNPERLNVHVTPKLVNGLAVIAFKVSFQLGA
jgi:phage tail sheath gpL-like